MKPARRQHFEKRAVELIEEAVHLLRQAPMATLAVYYIGSLPFVIGLLYFWAEMSRSPFAYEHLAGESLGLAALFLWMKVWQARFSRSLWAQVTGHSLAAFGWRQWRDVLTSQSALHAVGLLVLPLALVLTVPFGWVYAFYQSLTVTGGAEKAGLRSAFSKGWKHAVLWPGQNHRLLLVIFGFGAFVFLDWIIVSVSVPALLKTFLGIETVFTRSPLAVLNSTFFAAMLALTYLSVDPLVKAVYTLRCFYGEARSSGEDIKAELKQMGPPVGALSMAAIIIMLSLGAVRCDASCTGGRTALSVLCGTSVQSEATNRASFEPDVSVVPSGLIPLFAREPNVETLGYFRPSLRDGNAVQAAATDDRPGVRAESADAEAPLPSSSPSSSVSPPELDKQIGETLKESKYTWRFPRGTVKKPDEEPGVMGRFLERVGKWVVSVRDWIGEMLRKMFNRRSESRSSSGSDWIVFVHVLLYLLIAVVVIGVGISIYYLVRRRGQKQAPIASVPIQPAPDLTDENVGAEQLPEDGWTALGRELLQKGELRLALRAFYLASLAHLAARNLINLARFKSNRDYHRELERRAHSFPQVLALFGENVTVFDRIWYGMHETTPDLVNQFLSKVEMIKAA